MKHKPLGNRVQIEIEPEKNETDTGLTIGSPNPYKVAKVITVGPGLYGSDAQSRASLDVQVNDRVIIDPTSLMEIKYKNTVISVIAENNIILILGEDD